MTSSSTSPHTPPLQEARLQTCFHVCLDAEAKWLIHIKMEQLHEILARISLFTLSIAVFINIFYTFPRQSSSIQTILWTLLQFITFFFKQQLYENRFTFCSESTKLFMKLHCLATERSNIFSSIKSNVFSLQSHSAGRDYLKQILTGLIVGHWDTKVHLFIISLGATYTSQK